MGVKTDGIKYQGREIPAKLERYPKLRTAGEYTAANSYLVYATNQYRARKSGERYGSIPPYASSRIVFTGYDSKELTVTKRAKLEAWFDQQEIKPWPSQIIFVDKLDAGEKYWLTGTPVYDWAPVQEIKLEKSGTVTDGYGRSRPRGSYELAHYHRVDGSSHIEAEQIDTSKPILWTGTDERYLKFTDHGIPSDTTIVVLPANRREKFLRYFPTALAWRDYIRKEAKDWLDKQDPERVELAKYHISGVGARLGGLDPERVDDPDLVEAIRKQQAKVTDLVTGIQKRQRWLGDEFERYTLSSKYENPLKNYPLLLDRHNLNHDHVYLYINAAYAA